MARAFAKASSQYLAAAASPVTGYPHTMAAWFRSGTISPGSNQATINLSQGTGTDNNVSGMGIGNTSGKFQGYTSAGGGGFVIVEPGSALSPDTWYLGVWVMASATDRTAYIYTADGNGASANNTTTKTYSASMARTDIGRYQTGFSYMGGLIGEGAVWSAALTVPEIVSMAKSFSPLFIRPGSLEAYWPLIGRSSPEIDRVGGINLTLVNTPTVGAHPRVIMPRQNPTLFVEAGLSIPIAAYHYQQMRQKQARMI